MITLDTSGLFAILSGHDVFHEHALTALTRDPGPYIVPAATLGELSYLLERAGSSSSLDHVWADFESNGYVLDCNQGDIPRIRELIHRYADFPLGFVDAAVIACAERHGGHVLTTDFRHFGAVAREGTITLPLTI